VTLVDADNGVSVSTTYSWRQGQQHEYFAQSSSSSLPSMLDYDEAYGKHSGTLLDSFNEIDS
jgi:hypothetical protein